GKNHAMLVGSKAASGSRLLFTDADTTHQIHSVRCALATAVEKKADFLTLALWFKTAELNEPGSDLVLANGQFILVTKKAYEAVGGNESVKNATIEDV